MEWMKTGRSIDLTTGYGADMRFEEKDGTEVDTLSDSSGITLGDGTLQVTTETTTWPQNCTIYSDLQFTAPGWKYRKRVEDYRKT